MGIQLHVSREVLEKAGWNCWLEEEVHKDYDDNDEVFSYLVCEKDGFKFYSYSEDSLVIDANHWGSNRPRLIAAGLFELEHFEG